MDINEVRKEIDVIDDKICALFTERLKLSEQVAYIKSACKDEIYKPEREAEILDKVCMNVPDDKKDYFRELFAEIMRISREYQYQILAQNKQEQ